eukprot:CAMPEP_0185849264 /NCGR_PEP_ID=MMETSP1354-20130828/3814_1 /TAXON_ID=708628 /ORGANISM="Erythrolobus madagascarensis, Strain CCMP3276" /LENGTH=700 /DNA_ID=CAMNT_0028549753 /DNA_START=11 /DNA_END=2113 /DNA_ORIENTATION=-
MDEGEPTVDLPVADVHSAPQNTEHAQDTTPELSESAPDDINKIKPDAKMSYIRSEQTEGGTHKRHLFPHDHEKRAEFFCDNLESPQVDDFGRLAWWPWPTRGQKVPYPEKWRVYEADGKENPFTYWGVGLWWLSWVVCGADPATLHEPEDRIDALSDRFHWEKPPVGLERRWHPSDISSIELPKELMSHVNMQTLPYRMGLGRIILWLLSKKNVFGYLWLMTAFLIFLPGAWAILFYGSVPVGDYLRCRFQDFAVWLFVTNPITEVVWAFTEFNLMFACIDENLPWRPFWLYVPALATVYVIQVLFFLPISLTVGTFTCQALVGRAISYLMVVGWYFVLQRPVFAYPALYRNNPEMLVKRFDRIRLAWRAFKEPHVVTEAEHKLWKQWVKVSFVKSVILYTYAGYMIGVKEGSSSVQTLLGLLLSIAQIAFRKFMQHFAQPFHRDMNFLLSGLTVYNMQATFVAFSTPNIDMNDEGYRTNWHTYFVLFLGPLGDVITAFFHQSELWFRFRNWIKKIPKPVLCCADTTDYSAMGIKIDMDFDGRGTTNAHPDYRRAKAYFDFLVFLGSLAGYGAYMMVSWVFLFGPNKNRYPFNDIPELSFFEERGFTVEDWAWSIAFSLIVFITLLVGFVLFVWYLRRFYADVWPAMINSMYSYGRQPFKLGFAVLILTVTLSDTVIMLLNFSRVWYYDLGDTLGSCRGT